MRIIDKQHDFYDYLQDPTDTIVFDRRGSFILTKEMILDKLTDRCRVISYRCHYVRNPKRYLILQCGATYWHICLTLNDDDNDYTLELIDKWKDYNKPRVLIELYTYHYNYSHFISKDFNNNFSNKFNDTISKGYFDKDKVISHNVKITDNNNVKGGWIKEIQTIPILTACGIANIIDPVDVFTAIEEHFSLLKTEAERTEPLGASNDDKITMHGFDTKTSFRGKNK